VYKVSGLDSKGPFEGNRRYNEFFFASAGHRSQLAGHLHPEHALEKAGGQQRRALHNRKALLFGALHHAAVNNPIPGRESRVLDFNEANAAGAVRGSARH